MTGVHGFWTFCIILGFLHLSQSGVTPRTSFLIGAPGRPLSQLNDVQNTSTLLLSPDAATLFVGGRDAVLSIDVSQSDGITLKNKFDWVAPEDCGRDSGVSNKICTNFVRILQFINSTHLYACASGPSRPLYTILTADSLNISKMPEQVKGHCPYREKERSTALVVDGKLFTATTSDYFGKTPVIGRYFSDNRNDLQLSDPKPLKDATFISSFFIPSEGKVLFFFREEGTEYKFINEFTVSRVAQVCIDDTGGKRVLQKQWTSFAKSHLVCQVEKQLPFAVLQDIVMVPPADDKTPENTVFYGTFSSQWALASGRSAVCAFTLADIKAAFSGNYQTYNVETGQWKEKSNTDATLGKCGLHNASDSTLTLVKKAFLTAKKVQAAVHMQGFTSTEVYSRITAQRVQAHNGYIYTILYLLSETGYLHKVVLLKDRYHIIEAIQVFKQPQITTTILLSITKGVVFVGSSEGVIRVPVSNCSFYSSCAECVLTQDPFCGWDPADKACVPVSNMKSTLSQDVENGNVTEQCENLDNTALVPKEVYAHADQLVLLPCAPRSSLDHVSWRFSNHSVVPLSPYLQQREDNLLILVTPRTALEFHCVSEQQGLQETLAIYSVKAQVPAHSLSSSHTSLHPEYTPSSCLPLTHTKSYYDELLAVSGLLAVCLCLLAAATVCWWRRSHTAGHEQITN
ncbi:semaphorin-4A isoform X1 [Brachyhypopomus gauderio]|uniref:semaphorin-4A isoform X1 n=1 Tax=Brachyhypopomus gauderio TaxID=698409 RepID=UPI004041F9EA